MANDHDADMSLFFSVGGRIESANITNDRLEAGEISSNIGFEKRYSYPMLTVCCKDDFP